MIDITFKFNKNEEQRVLDVYHNIKVVYVKEDKALNSLNGGGNCFLCTGCAYTNISFDLESKRVGGIGDLLGDLNRFKKKEIVLADKIKKGILYVETLEELEVGAGYDISFDNSIFYDPKNHILQMGKYDNCKELLKILGNVYVQIQEDKLQSILIVDIK